jgi:hypothetical protein
VRHKEGSNKTTRYGGGEWDFGALDKTLCKMYLATLVASSHTEGLQGEYIGKSEPNKGLQMKHVGKLEPNKGLQMKHVDKLEPNKGLQD